MRSLNFNRLCSDCQLEEPTERPRMLSGLVTSGLLCFNCWLRGPVAQRLEQGTHNPLVPGSNPGGPSPEIDSSLLQFSPACWKLCIPAPGRNCHEPDHRCHRERATKSRREHVQGR